MNRCGLFGIRHNGIATLEWGCMGKKRWRIEMWKYVEIKCPFFGSKISQHLQLCMRAHYRATRKNLESRTQLDNPVECASGGVPLLLYKILHLVFFPVVRTVLDFAVRVEKIINTILMKDVWNFNVLGRGDVSPTHSEICQFISGS